LLTDFAIGHDVVGIVEVHLVYLFTGHKLVDLYRALALNCYGLKFLGLDVDILTLADLVALDDLSRIDLLSGLGVHLPVFDAVAGILVDLMEADFFASRSGWK